MAWGDLANNQMPTFTDAQSGGFTLNAGQSSVTSNQCMTKTDALAKYSLNATNMSSYGALQLVPKSAWINGYNGPIFIANGVPTLFTGTSVSIPYPATVSAGDFIILRVRAETPSTSDITTPSGFTRIEPPASDFTSLYQVNYYKFASGSEGGTSVTVTSTGASRVAGMTIQYRKVNTSIPYIPSSGSVYASSAGGTSNFTNLNTTSTAANQLGVALFSITTPTISSAGSGTWTYRGGGTFSAGQSHAFVSATQEVPTSGTALGTITVVTPTTTSGIMLTLLLNPI